MGESVVYVDDNSDFTKDEDPTVLNANIQCEAEKSTNWLRDNRLCVAGEKSKLMILGHSELRARKNLNEPMKIYIDGKEVVETVSEKLLGIVVNNTLTWKNHLYGDQDNIGLVAQLGKRLGMLTKISKFMSKKKLRLFSNGIFYSKLNYCLHVFGNIFGMDSYREVNRKYFSFTVKDNNTLQTLQNKLNRMLISNTDYNTPTSELLRRTGSLSIHQLIAYFTAVNTYKIIQSGKPVYIANKMKPRLGNWNTRQGANTLNIPRYRLNIAREGFIFRGATIFNKLDENLRKEPMLQNFKNGVRKWVESHISIKPKQTFRRIPAAYQGQHQPRPPEPQPRLPLRPENRQMNLITRYFNPQRHVVPADDQAE